MDKQGKEVPYLRTNTQIKDALANVEANKHQGNDQKGKGGGKGKGKCPLTCFYCGDVGHRIADCPQKANGQPAQAPNGKGAEKGKAPKQPPGKGGPKGYGEPGSSDQPCWNHQAGKCQFGADCIFQHAQ